MTGTSPDGKGEFEYLANPRPLGNIEEPPQGDPRLNGTNKIPAVRTP